MQSYGFSIKFRLLNNPQKWGYDTFASLIF